MKRAPEITGMVKIWRLMLRRCENPSDANYPKYGACGIRVCERWHRFDDFLADMRVRPPCTSIDRINNDGNYEPGNCRWADPVTQSRNRRNARFVTVNGASMRLCDAAAAIGASRSAIFKRAEAGVALDARRFPKLSPGQVEQIRARAKSPDDDRILASEFCVSKQFIGQIRRGVARRAVASRADKF